MQDLLRQLNSDLENELPVVLCSILATRGSTPQKPGAAMLIYPDGRQIGTIGGGCVEAEIKQAALQSLHQDNMVEVRNIFLDDIQGWDDGLICGGRMSILVHPFQGKQEAAAFYYRQLHTLVKNGSGFIEAVVCEESAGQPPGDRYLLDAAQLPIHCLAATPAWDSIRSLLSAMGPVECPMTHQGIAFLPTRPRIKLLIVGAGHVGQAVGKLAADVGFELWVMDDRAQFASKTMFPQAQRLMVGNIGSTISDLLPSLDANTYALIITRGHKHDEEALYHLADSACSYVGMIGSKRKIRIIVDDLESKGINKEALARVHAPIGLEIGSQTVPEIAISIVAELIAFRNLGYAPLLAKGRPGGAPS